MPQRLYFLCGDLLSNLISGGLTGIACAVLIGPSWPMVTAMLVGMFLGMILATPLGAALGVLFGAMELMLPVMLSGMMSGMGLSMLAAMEPVSWRSGAALGAFIGLISLAFTYVMNTFLRGEDRRWIV